MKIRKSWLIIAGIVFSLLIILSIFFNPFIAFALIIPVGLGFLFKWIPFYIGFTGSKKEDDLGRAGWIVLGIIALILFGLLAVAIFF